MAAAPIHRASNVRTNLQRFRQSFRVQAHTIGHSLRAEARVQLRRVRTVPRWVRIFHKIYHEYGLKHVVLILILVVYQFLGAGIFYFCEASHEESKEAAWKEDIRENRTIFIAMLIPTMFNNSEYLFFLSAAQTARVERRLDAEIAAYEKQLGIKYSDQKIRWDFWNAMLYAQTICTTIGYGHLYASTVAGRVFTMIYAIVGIPLVLSILDDLGKLLTRCLKTPWFLMKCGCRRMFRYCTKQTLVEIRRLDEEDRQDLAIFDLPIPVAIFVVVAWIFICSATFCIWERDWDYFVAFYFFFISLSTIGLGDITPTQPKYLLMLFGYIIIGLSLVSMCINLIQAKLERTYEAGRGQFDNSSMLSSDHHINNRLLEVPSLKKRESYRGAASSLGVIRRNSSTQSFRQLSNVAQHGQTSVKKTNKTCQTMLSFPSPSRNHHICRSASGSTKIRLLPRTLSIDDVMKLVDTEEGDMLILTELTRESSAELPISELSDSRSDISSAANATQLVISRSFDANFNLPQTAITTAPPPQPQSISAVSAVAALALPTLHEIEAMEEMEDRILLGSVVVDSPSLTTSLASGVHFRSRLSLIPEHQDSSTADDDHSTTVANKSPILLPPDDDDDMESDDDDTRPLELDYRQISTNSGSSPTAARRRKLSEMAPKRISNFIDSLLRRGASSSQ